MNLFTIKKIAEEKRVTIKSIAEEISMTEANLHRCIKLGRIEAGVLEKIALKLEVPIDVFFEDEIKSVKNIIKGRDMRLDKVQFGQTNNMHVSPAEAEIEYLKKEIDYLKKAVEEKERMIQLLIEKK